MNQNKLLLLFLFYVNCVVLPMQANAQTNQKFVTWLKDYIPAQYSDATLTDHGGWFQAHVGDLVVSWAEWKEEGITLQNVEGLREGKSLFINTSSKEVWSENDAVTYFEGTGYYISDYSSSSMSNWKVGTLTIVQFDGESNTFVEDMSKAWKALSLVSKSANSTSTTTTKRDYSKPRIINTTDLGADPDDEQSMVRQLVSANEFDIEGLIVSTGCWKKNQSNTGMLDKILNAYDQVYENLTVHADGYPTPEYLKSISVMGNTGYGMADVGEGKDSPGSEMIIAAADKDDPRPLWVTGWGGVNTIAQAVWKVRETRSPEEFSKFLSKIRVFDILGQDDAGAWLAKTFPELFYIRATGVYGWAPSDEYLDEHIQNHGPLGAVYPDRKWATEGDTPAFMHIYPNGLNDPDQIDQGSWGGRFSFDKQMGIRSMSGVKKETETKYDPYYMYGNTPEKAKAIKRWSKGYNNNFAARMDWSVTNNYENANHHPTAVLNGDTSRQVLEISASPGSSVSLNTDGSSDPDGDSLNYSWSFYKEPSSYDGEVKIQNNSSSSATVEIPSDAAGKNIHIILELHDSGSPSLYAYRRVIFNVK